VLLVLKNILLFFFILRVASKDQILNMTFEQIEAFLKKMQSEPELKNEVLAAPTADDIARIALKLGFEFSGDELLRMSGKKVGSITVRKTDLPGEYN
jgi:predicted ribosomally synthesized peptide with nif11-like leader